MHGLALPEEVPADLGVPQLVEPRGLLLTMRARNAAARVAGRFVRRRLRRAKSRVARRRLGRSRWLFARVGAAHLGLENYTAIYTLLNTMTVCT